MLTKDQKKKQIEEGKEALRNSRFLVFADFTKTGVEDLKKLRRNLKNVGAAIKVFKKKLLRIAFSESGFDFNPERFESQAAMIFSAQDISEIAGSVYKFSKSLKKDNGFGILGAYDLSSKLFIDAETVKKIGQLPPREILLAQLVGMFSAPLKMFMSVLQERGKKVG
ncbi:MAG: 50S ribosomal protein L10 [Patescibacteria group bacterium]